MLTENTCLQLNSGQGEVYLYKLFINKLFILIKNILHIIYTYYVYMRI